ncbi:MAG: hypothetical protein FWD17_13570 [Polyangiaceae bacterium]|nr:hypothetical protein [Polyangiaceae bacterium]
MPVLVDDRGPLFGTENIVREIVRRSGRGAEVVLRGDVTDRAHLPFREVAGVSSWTHLGDFARRFGERASARDRVPTRRGLIRRAGPTAFPAHASPREPELRGKVG